MFQWATGLFLIVGMVLLAIGGGLFAQSQDEYTQKSHAVLLRCRNGAIACFTLGAIAMLSFFIGAFYSVLQSNNRRAEERALHERRRYGQLPTSQQPYYGEDASQCPIYTPSPVAPPPYAAQSSESVNAADPELGSPPPPPPVDGAVPVGDSSGWCGGCGRRAGTPFCPQCGTRCD